MAEVQVSEARVAMDLLHRQIVAADQPHHLAHHLAHHHLAAVAEPEDTNNDRQ